MKSSGVLRRIFVGFAVLILLAAGAIAAGSWFLSLPPDPETASREEILQWLVVGDVAEQPHDTQVGLVDRLEEELELESVASSAELTPAQKRQLLQNISTLKYVWFVERVEAYSQLESDEQQDFLDDRIETVMTWSALESRLEADDQGAAIGQFFDEIEKWVVRETDPVLREKMKTTVHDGVFRWLATHSVEELPFSVRKDLALRIASQFKSGLAISDQPSSAPAEQKQLRSNSEMLLEAWLRHQAGVYASLPATERAAYLREQIDTIEGVNVIQLLSEPGDQQRAMMRLLALSEQWINAAPADEQRQMRTLLSAVQIELLRRKFRSET